MNRGAGNRRGGAGVSGAGSSRAGAGAGSEVTLETVSRELHRLEEAGLIELMRGGVLVNVETLEARLEFSV